MLIVSLVVMGKLAFNQLAKLPLRTTSRGAMSSWSVNMVVLIVPSSLCFQPYPTQAFMATWNAACAAVGAVKLHIPAGTYLIGPTKFAGPCKNVRSLTVNMKASSCEN